MKVIEDEVCYEPTDFDEQFQQIVDEAKQLWARRIAERIRAHGQQQYFAATGSGISVAYLPPRHKKPKLRMIIEPNSLVPPPSYPNNVLVWQDSAPEVVAFLKTKGIESIYLYGLDD